MLRADPPFLAEKTWRLDRISSQDEVIIADRDVHLNATLLTGPQRHLQGRTGQSEGLPKRPDLHLHDLPHRSPARRNLQIHLKRRGARLVLAAVGDGSVPAFRHLGCCGEGSTIGFAGFRNGL